LLVGIGACFTLFAANANALVQLAAPEHLRGRLGALYLFAFVGLAPIGSLLSGWLVELGGTALAFAITGVAGLLAIGVVSARRTPHTTAVPSDPGVAPFV
jgi:MFS family permease